MKRRLLTLAMTLIVMLTALVVLSACDDNTTTPQKLSTPTVTLSGDTASWSADANADKFEISIDGTLSFVENTVTGKTLTNGQTLKVRAVGNGIAYSTSDWSNSVTYTATPAATTPVKLAPPTVTISQSGLAVWSAVANAAGYSYKINNGTETATTATSVQLSDGQSITVKAVGDGTNYTDSEYSSAQTYTASTPTPGPTKLATPEVSISATGLARWSAIGNATGYLYKINGGAEIPTASTSVQLSDGQSITVKAVGDGANYTDSEYSTPKTYTPSTASVIEPTYLGIFASGSEPSVADGLPSVFSTASMRLFARRMMLSSRSLEEALGDYFTDSANYLGATMPTVSDYDIYSAPEQTVYIQIWLDNPQQYTILSLMLNGTKYQVSGGLSSFFIEEGGQHYNCVYVAVKIPAGSYTEKTYTVSNIEYISNTYINEDGTDEFMNNNNAIRVGLPYNATYPTVSDYDQTTLTYNSFSANFMLSDRALADLAGAWLGVAVYDDYNIVTNQVVTPGLNTISVTGLAENQYYSLVVYLYGDLHDGSGVTAHCLSWFSFVTESVISEFSAEASYYSEFGMEGICEADSGLAIDIAAYLRSSTAEFDRLEVCLDNTPVYTDDDFYGYTTVTGLLASTQYVVRIYYSDSEYTEHYEERYVTTGTLSAPSMDFKEGYPFLNAAALTFESFENGYLRVALGKDVQIRIFKNIEEVRYAEYILLLCDDPDVLAEAQARYDAAYQSGDYGLASKIYHEELYYLQYANHLMQNGDYCAYNTDKAAWQTLFDANSATYTFSNEDLFTNNGTAFLIVRDFFDKFGTEYTYYEITANVDYKDGNGYVRTLLEDGDFSLSPINSSDHYLSFDFSIDGYTVTVDPSCRINYEDRDVAIVTYSVGIYKDWELVETLYTSSEINWGTLDEEAWINAYVLAMKGEAILPSEEKIIEYFDWRAIFEIINGIQIQAENDYLDGGGDVTTGDGEITGGGVITGGFGGEKNIANQAERALLHALLAYEYPTSYEYRFKTQMLEAFQYDRDYYTLISGCTTDDERLVALINGAYNSTVVSVLNACVDNLRHYMTWYGSGSDEIFIGFKAAFEQYITENSLVSSVNWGASYRRVMMFEDFYTFYPLGSFEVCQLTIDPTLYPAGEYRIGVEFRFDDYDAEYFETRLSDDVITIEGALPVPTFQLADGRYLSDPEITTQDFWGYHFELELLDSTDGTVYTGVWDRFQTWDHPLQLGYKARMRAVINDGERTYYTNSEWSEWLVFNGVKITTPSFSEFDLETCCVEWYTYDSNVASYVYTINGGAMYTVAVDGNLSVFLSSGDILRVKAIAVTGDIYLDSDWAEFTCTDTRTAVATPTNLTLSNKLLQWEMSSTENVSGYYIYQNGELVRTIYTPEKMQCSIYMPESAVYTVQAISENQELYRNSAISDSVLYEPVVDDI